MDRGGTEEPGGQRRHVANTTEHVHTHVYSYSGDGSGIALQLLPQQTACQGLQLRQY